MRGPARRPAAFRPRHHPPDPPAAEDVHMEMRHFLPAIGTHVGQHAIAAGLDAEILRHLRHRAPEAGDLGIRPVRAEIGDGDIPPLRDHQHMHRRLRIDVMEGEGMRVLMHALARDLPTQDAGEDVGVVIRGQAGHGHGRGSCVVGVSSPGGGAAQGDWRGLCPLQTSPTKGQWPLECRLLVPDGAGRPERRGSRSVLAGEDYFPVFLPRPPRPPRAFVQNRPRVRDRSPLAATPPPCDARGRLEGDAPCP